MFQIIVFANTNNPKNQPDTNVSDLSGNPEGSEKEKTFDPEGRNYFDVEKLFDKLIHGEL